MHLHIISKRDSEKYKYAHPHAALTHGSRSHWDPFKRPNLWDEQAIFMLLPETWKSFDPLLADQPGSRASSSASWRRPEERCQTHGPLTCPRDLNKCFWNHSFLVSLLNELKGDEMMRSLSSTVITDAPVIIIKMMYFQVGQRKKSFFTSMNKRINLMSLCCPETEKLLVQLLKGKYRMDRSTHNTLRPKVSPLNT